MARKLNEVPIVILAGGKGTRLSEVSGSNPKYLIQINENKCFADFHLDWVKSQGFSRVIICVGFLGDKIKNYCGDGKKFGLTIEYIEDGETPLGTGGAVANVLKFNFKNIAITYGDSLLNLNCEEVYSKFEIERCIALMTVCKINLGGHFPNSDLRNNQVRYNKYNPDADWKYIDYGFVILNRKVITDFPHVRPFDLADKLFELGQENKLFGFEATNRFWEIGTPRTLAEFKSKFTTT